MHQNPRQLAVTCPEVGTSGRNTPPVDFLGFEMKTGNGQALDFTLHLPSLPHVRLGAIDQISHNHPSL